MRLVDANILIYAYDRGSKFHEKACSWLDDQLNGLPRTGIPWVSLLGFVRIISNPRIFEHPASIQEAWNQVMEWLQTRSAWIPQPTGHHAEVMNRIIGGMNLKANDVPDAHLAALAIEHGLTICSTDSDFARYPDLRWENPLR